MAVNINYAHFPSIRVFQILNPCAHFLSGKCPVRLEGCHNGVKVILYRGVGLDGGIIPLVDSWRRLSLLSPSVFVDGFF